MLALPATTTAYCTRWKATSSGHARSVRGSDTPMSLRKGHLRSRVWAPPKHIDEWQDRAKCAGMMNHNVDPSVCDGCPVTVECLDLFYQLDEIMDGMSQRGEKMDGTWGGRDFTAEKYKQTNIGECIVDKCDGAQATSNMCNMHYQRWKKARADGVELDGFVTTLRGEYARPNRNQFTKGNG